MPHTIANIEANIRHLSAVSTRWHILTSEAGEPLAWDAPSLSFIPTTYHHASLFTPENVPGVAEQAALMNGASVKSMALVDYLDNLRDKLVRQERAEAGRAIHAA
ncbi:hypothetical protein AhyVDH1_049 [Aeromonas phage AhyVDH1]|nr:hypothetical protein AhyVDH1_049 [Aeromonas phage AhyVDH1]